MLFDCFCFSTIMKLTKLSSERTVARLVLLVQTDGWTAPGTFGGRPPNLFFGVYQLSFTCGGGRITAFLSPPLPPSGHMTSDLGLYMDLLGTASGETLAPLGLVERWNSTNSDDDDAPRTTPDHLSAPPPLHPPVPPALCLSPSLSA